MSLLVKNKTPQLSPPNKLKRKLMIEQFSSASK